MTDNAVVNVRSLAVRDLVPISGILAKSSSSTLAKLALMTDGQVDASEFGITLLVNVLGVGGEDIMAWFADLCGMDKDAFGALPPAVAFDVIEALIKDPNIKDFFTRASKLASSVAALRKSSTSSSPATTVRKKNY